MLQPSQLRQAVRQALAFYGLFSYPLTPQEALGAANAPGVSVGEVMDALEADPACAKDSGYYFLRGQQAGAAHRRQERYLLAQKKYKKVRWFIRVLSMVPYVRLVCVCNTLSYSNSTRDSDIDLFVVARARRAHFCRMLCGFLAAAFGLRPKDGNHRDKVCLSFFVDEDSLNLRELRSGEDDVFFHHWLLQMAPMYDAGGFFSRLMEENAWARERLPNFTPKREYRRAIKHGPALRVLKKALEALTQAFLRPAARKALLGLEERRFPAEIRQMRNRDACVVITDGVLKFHPNDRRAEYVVQLAERMKELEATPNDQEQEQPALARQGALA